MGGFANLIDQELQEHDEDQLKTHQQVVLDVHTARVKYLIGQRQLNKDGSIAVGGLLAAIAVVVGYGCVYSED